MTTHRKIPSILVAVVAAVALLVALPQSAQSEPGHRSNGSLVGEWTMTELQVGTPGNLQPIPYSGQVIFTSSGTMAVQAQNPDASAPDTAYTVNGYEAFYGKISVQRRSHNTGTVAVTVTSAAARALEGKRLTRNFRVTGNTLVLTPTDPAEGFRVTYKRS